MNCQIVHDSMHARPGWTDSYLLRWGETIAGYGAVLIGGPWNGQPTVFEWYLLPPYRSHTIDLFKAFLIVCGAGSIRSQTNDPFFELLIPLFAKDIESEKILFEHHHISELAPGDATFRGITPADQSQLDRYQWEMGGDWIVLYGGAIAARGGLAFHYNRPFADLYMEVAEPFRKQGLGTYLVHKLIRVCFEKGNMPAARCNPENVASHRTLLKAGFRPCGHILTGSLKASTT
jgi:RimJ/RimL family protein N-acetyltransferase